jgi:hypothetical protein
MKSIVPVGSSERCITRDQQTFLQISLCLYLACPLHYEAMQRQVQCFLARLAEFSRY